MTASPIMVLNGPQSYGYTLKLYVSEFKEKTYFYELSKIVGSIIMKKKYPSKNLVIPVIPVAI